MPARKKFNTLKRKLVPTLLFIAKQAKFSFQREKSDNFDNPNTNMNLGRLQEFKDDYDQRAFESKSTLDSMLNSISTNQNTMGRIKEEKNEIRRQIRREQESYNQVESDYKSLKAETNHLNKKIASHKLKTIDLKRIKYEKKTSGVRTKKI
jgi:chromosome segregation ATPase